MEDCAHCQEELRRALTSQPRSMTSSVSCCTGNHAPINTDDQLQEESALIIAVKRGFTLAVQELLSNGIDVDRTDEDGRSALHYAAKNGNIDVVRHLLTSAANVNARDIYGFTPLMLASRQGHDHVVQSLVDAGSDVNIANELGETALFYASKDRSIRSTDRCAQILIDNAANIEHMNINGCTALHMAAVFRKRNVVKMLLRKSCKTTNVGKLSFVRNFRSVEMEVTPIEVAFLTGSFDICNMLISAGSNTNVLMKHITSDPDSSDQIPDWLDETIRNPQTLKCTCRSRVRQYCGNEANDVIHDLYLPVQIKEFLCLNDLG